MKKIIGALVSAVLMMNIVSFNTSAQETVTGIDNGENISVQYGASDCEWAIVNGYTEGKLAMSCKSEKTEDGFVFSMPQNSDDMQMRISYSNGEIYPFSIEAEAEEQASQTPAPHSSEKPSSEVSQTPSSQPTQEPEEKEEKREYPQTYEKRIDALHAPAVVVDSQISVLDGENCYTLTLLYTGEEIAVSVRDSIVINSAPKAWAELEGKELSYLKKGDVIHFLCDVMGRVKTVDLMYRPEFESHIANGDAFEDLYNSDGYSKYYFGVPIDAKKGYILIAEADGKAEEIELNSSVLVYTVEQGGKKPLCEFSGFGAGAISKTYIAKSNLDDDGNVISWSDVDDETYALVRTVRGEATDVIVFVR